MEIKVQSFFCMFWRIRGKEEVEEEQSCQIVCSDWSRDVISCKSFNGMITQFHSHPWFLFHIHSRQKRDERMLHRIDGIGKGQDRNCGPKDSLYKS